MPQLANYEQYIRTVEDFPVPGVQFYDIAPLIGDGEVFTKAIEDLVTPLRNESDLTKIVSFDARGFIFGAAMAARLGVGCVMLRKPGKLSGETHRADYDLEYGTNALEIQKNVLDNTDKVVLVDDIIATGGTAIAGIDLVQRCGSQIIEFCALIDLPRLGGSDRIIEAGVTVRPILTFGDKS